MKVNLKMPDDNFDIENFIEITPVFTLEEH